MSLAILADEEPAWRPNEYREEDAGCVLYFRFPTNKLLDYTDREEERKADPNPFAIITLAHLKTQQTRRDDPARSA